MSGATEIGLRPATQVMRLARMGASFPTRLSFLRVLLRQLSAEGAKVTRPVWQIDVQGFGHAVYSVSLGGHVYSLVAFANDLPAELRTDRVIATAWDTSYVLYDGVPDAGEIARLAANAPLQEAGRFTPRDLVLSRANKSVRLFAAVVEALRAGGQPDAGQLRDIGYLMRTTAVYGNGKFGIADRAVIADRPGLGGPFMAEMLTVWLIRGFTHDLVEHMGSKSLDTRLKRNLGIGNATGLGLAPFLVSHPLLLNNWVLARETALARVLALPRLSVAKAERLCELGARAARHLAEWQVPDPIHQARIEALCGDWAGLMQGLTKEALVRDGAAGEVMTDSAKYGLDAQELAVAWLLEPMGDVIDDLAESMASDRTPPINPAMAAARLAQLCEDYFGWALKVDFDDPAERAQFWYVSEEKAEPRLGMRFEEDGAELESPLDIARRVQNMYRDLQKSSGNIAAFLMAHPEHRYVARRVQWAAAHPYSEINDNLTSADCLPIDMLRCKLAFFGAARFDPKSDRWTRITLCQGAPLFDELGNADDWWLPEFGA